MNIDLKLYRKYKKADWIIVDGFEIFSNEIINGKEALKKVKCYLGVPKEFEGKKFEVLKAAHMSKMTSVKYIKIGELAQHLGK